MRRKSAFLSFLILFLAQATLAWCSTTQTRMDEDLALGNPIVIQASVALADNKHQWIAPVPAAIGNGQDARTNLYWGARYGLRTYLIRDGGWKKVATFIPSDKRILERVVLKRSFPRNGRTVPVYLVADAWDGRYIEATIRQFLAYNAGRDTVEVELDGGVIRAGGRAHLIVYIGHNALMDYAGIKNRTVSDPITVSDNPDNDAVVLACKSKSYFLPRLEKAGASPLVLTTGLMAPEAYSLHAAIEQWVAGESAVRVRKAAAAGYNRYQKTGSKAAERLFDVK
jgi:hypothetical protein